MEKENKKGKTNELGSKSWLPSIPSKSIYGGTQKTKLPLPNN
jgi:hypothetical protein